MPEEKKEWLSKEEIERLAQEVANLAAEKTKDLPDDTNLEDFKKIKKFVIGKLEKRGLEPDHTFGEGYFMEFYTGEKPPRVSMNITQIHTRPP